MVQRKPQLKAYNLFARNKAVTIGFCTSMIPVVPSPRTNLDSIDKIIIDIFENETKGKQFVILFIYCLLY
jgi:hypothetical protein